MTELLLLAGYALALLGAARGLLVLGRRSTSPWTSRVLAGHVRVRDDPPEAVAADDWPHSEVPRLYTRVALVATLAAAALALGSLLLHPYGAGAAVPAAVLVLSAVALRRSPRW